MATVLTPPAALPSPGTRTVFLAGSIEMGSAEDWQSQVAAALADVEPLVVLNPRREAWDSSWRQSIDEPLFREQVEWELSGLERATVVAFYFAPTTKAPITLLELGLWARSGKVVVCCPEGYFRKGNVDIVCARYGAPQVATLEALVAAVRQRLSEAGRRAR